MSKLISQTSTTFLLTFYEIIMLYINLKMYFVIR